MRCGASNNDGLGQLGVDIVAPVLDGHGAAASAAGNYGDGFAAVATQGKQESIQFLVVSFNALDDIFLFQSGGGQIHGRLLLQRL